MNTQLTPGDFARIYAYAGRSITLGSPEHAQLVADAKLVATALLECMHPPRPVDAYAALDALMNAPESGRMLTHNCLACRELGAVVGELLDLADAELRVVEGTSPSPVFSNAVFHLVGVLGDAAAFLE